MSIQSEVTRIQEAKADLASAIEEQGVSVASTDTIDTYADKVRTITERLPTTGGNLTGDITMYTPSGDSPSLIFQRGTLTDNYNDWRIQDRGGYLYIEQRGSGSTAWQTILTLTQSGATLSGTLSGTASVASKLGTADKGSATQPIYLAAGVPTACTYTLGKSVPSNAVFTDTNTKVTAVGNHYTPSGGTTKSASGATAAATGTTVQVVTGVTVDAAGHVTGVTSGAVQDRNTTYSAATTSAQGLMSAADKTKLDGIATGANAYTLPTASSTLGGVKTTSTVTSTSGLTACPIISGVPYYKDTNTTYSAATTSANGLMSSSDKTKLDGIATGATKVTIDTAMSSTSTNPVQNKVIYEYINETFLNGAW